MPLTKLQKGAIGENEFEKLAILETDGALQVGRPLTHDERRDREIYRRGTIAAGLAVQVRIRMDALTARQTIWITVTVARAHLRSSRRSGTSSVTSTGRRCAFTNPCSWCPQLSSTAGPIRDSTAMSGISISTPASTRRCAMPGIATGWRRRKWGRGCSALLKAPTLPSPRGGGKSRCLGFCS